ncbi:MAG: HAMP domain-containing histidine kinase [Lachnospiraceae bacterium]|nr:HAMP domain-containing histidine kinase [Lachnospiraceae bacterium]
MSRNKVLVWYVCSEWILFLLSMFLYWMVPTGKWIVAGCGMAVVMIPGFIYYAYRERTLKKLSGYLTRVRNGHYEMELQDYKEGELSILKSEIYKMTLMLTEQAELLKKDKVYLADAISDISHQLKTPLTSIGMMADFLNADALPEEKRKEFARNILHSLNRMSWLVTSLLKISKLDAGTIVLKKETILLKDVIDSAVKDLLVLMDIRQITFSIEGNEDDTVLGDRLWLSEAVGNFVKNAVEHTKEGGRITVRYEENRLYSSIVIEDNGSGIAKEDLPHIFERFYRGKNSGVESVGIGLALAKQIVVMQKGSVSVESKEGVGTKFCLRVYR